MKSISIKNYTSLCLFVVLIFAPLYYYELFVRHDLKDFMVHIRSAQIVSEGHIRFLSPHFLMQVLLIALHSVFTFSFLVSTFIIVILSQCFTAAILFNELREQFKQRLPAWVLTALAISLLLAFPLSLLYFADHELYLGYLAGNVYHNPTIVLVKPFALLLSLYAVKVFTSNKNNGNRNSAIVWCALVAVAAAAAKPSYSIVILPATAIMAAVAFYRKRYINFKLLLGGIFIPTLTVLVLQFIWNYRFAERDSDSLSKIIWAPLVVIKMSSGWIAIKFFLSVVFPLYMLVVFFKEMRNKVDMQLAWVSFIISISYSYLLAEEGPNLVFGSFFWGTQICIFLLFFYTLIFLATNIIERGINSFSKLYTDKKIFIGCILYLLHLGSGAVFFLSKLQPAKWFS